MKSKIWKWVGYGLALSPLLMVAAVYTQLPAQIPTNWSLSGEVGYSDRWQLWGIAGLAPVLAALFAILPRIDPRKTNYAKFQGGYDCFCTIMMLFLNAMVGIVISESLRPGRLSVDTFVILLVGLLFMFIGNMMPKIKSNFFMGIKNPWTLSSDQVWNRTHRMAGWFWVSGGLFMALSVFIPVEQIRFAFVLVIMLVIIGTPTIASYIWFKQERKDS